MITLYESQFAYFISLIAFLFVITSLQDTAYYFFVLGIHVKFKGEAHTEWSESKEEQDAEGKTQSTDTIHTGNEEYFQITYYLLGSNTGRREFVSLTYLKLCRRMANLVGNHGLIA